MPCRSVLLGLFLRCLGENKHRTEALCILINHHEANFNVEENNSTQRLGTTERGTSFLNTA